jgi:uncharacterized phiE125 gp8 family phage protein
MPLQLITPPAVEPVTLADARLHLKVDTTDDDALITRLITAARARAEWHTGRALNTQRWILWLDAWPPRGIIEIPLPSLQSVTSVTVYAPDDSATMLDPATYQVDAESAPARLTLKSTMSPPTICAPSIRSQWRSPPATAMRPTMCPPASAPPSWS